MDGGTIRRGVGFALGLGGTSVALSSGFIWAYQGRTPLVFAAAFFAWTGYLGAHYALTGHLVDDSDHDEASPVTGVIPDERWRQAGVVGGAAVLVGGMVVGVVFIRAENHLATNLGGVLFLGGYVVAHYAETDTLL